MDVGNASVCADSFGVLPDAEFTLWQQHRETQGNGDASVTRAGARPPHPGQDMPQPHEETTQKLPGLGGELLTL